jgi:hypothetical protein
MAILLEASELPTKSVAREAERCTREHRRKLDKHMEKSRLMFAVEFRLVDEAKAGAKAAAFDAATPDSVGVDEPSSKVRTGGARRDPSFWGGPAVGGTGLSGHSHISGGGGSPR